MCRFSQTDDSFVCGKRNEQEDGRKIGLVKGQGYRCKVIRVCEGLVGTRTFL